jgi:hypothetical protein
MAAAQKVADGRLAITPVTEALQTGHKTLALPQRLKYHFTSYRAVRNF